MRKSIIAHAGWRQIIALILIVIAATSLAACRSSGKPETGPESTASVSGTEGEQTLVVLPDDGIGPILDLIENADSSIRFKIYLLTHRDVRAALVRAANRGVDVRVLIEQNPTGGGESNQESFDVLREGGVQVRWTNPDFRLTHEKSLMVDDRTALIGTFNYTVSSFGSNREYGIISTEPDVVSEVALIFDSDWNSADYKLPAESALVVSPLNSRQTIEDLIDDAQSQLWLEQATLLDDEITEHLVAAARRGVAVRFIGPLRADEDDFAAANHQRLRDAGGQVALMADPLVHAKVILADDRQALIGSINLTYSSMDLNRELGILTTDPGVLARLRKTMAADWERVAQVVEAPDSPITWQEAMKYVGAEVIVEGEIVRTHNTGKVTFLNFDSDYRNSLSLVIFPDTAQLFPQPPEDLFLNRRVQASGLVKEYQGAPEIIIENPNQLRLLDADSAAMDDPPQRTGETIADAVASSPVGTISWQDAGNYIGQDVTVEGEVVRTYDSGNVTFLNFTDNWRGTFSAVVFAADYGKYPRPPAELFLDQTVKITGEVKEYQGAPEIVIESPEQIEIIDSIDAQLASPEPESANDEAGVAQPVGVIPWQQAEDYLGQTITVSGKIINANDIGSITFLNFSNERGKFVAVVFADDYAAFPQPPVQMYDGREVWITGEVETYRNAPQIIVRSPDQIEVFD
ncbi:MAG: hypothetical protein J5I90_19415 [Caldilineales bacterium]|nr:hypothetical protein [Caldilineales bacterium]